MIIPFIASVMRDVFEVTPPMLKESAYGLGSTTWEVVSQGRAALHQGRRHRRHHAGPGPRAGRDHGRHLRDRQLQPARFAVAVRSRPTASPRRWPTSSPKPASGLHQAALIYLGLVLFFITFVVLSLSKLLLARLRKSEGSQVHDARRHRRAPARARPTPSASASGSSRARKRVNSVALALSLAAMAFGVFWLVWILWETLRLGIGGLAWATFTEMTPPPNEAGGIANAIFGSFADGGAGHLRRHADRHHGRHLPGRVRPQGLARLDHALRQRHPAVGAVDRDRPVRLRGGGGALQAASPAGPARWRWR